MSAEIVLELQELQVRRKHYIKTATKITNATGALVRRDMGWTRENPDAEAIKGRAAKLVATWMAKMEVPKGENETAEALLIDLTVARDMILISDKARHQIELKMQKLARKLPGYAFAKSITGFGDLGFAVLVGEAGDLAKYAKHDKLWKRLGLAPYNGMALSNWRKKGGLSTDEWLALGYAPRRRAEVYAVIEDPLFRHQASKEGPYHAVYLARRERTAETHPDWTKGHSHHDAKRVMVKKLVSDLWSEWRRAGAVEPIKAISSLPASSSLHAAL